MQHNAPLRHGSILWHANLNCCKHAQGSQHCQHLGCSARWARDAALMQALTIMTFTCGPGPAARRTWSRP